MPSAIPLVFTACYLLVGGALLVGFGSCRRATQRAGPGRPRGLAALVFLALFSSTFGFVAYSYLLLHETPSRLGTYAYVNPLVAVIVGWLLLGERLDTRQVLGASIILAGVCWCGARPCCRRVRDSADTCRIRLTGVSRMAYSAVAAIRVRSAYGKATRTTPKSVGGTNGQCTDCG